MKKFFYISILILGAVLLFSFCDDMKLKDNSIIGTWVVDHYFKTENLIEFKRRKKINYKESGYIFKENGELLVKARVIHFCGNANKSKKKDYSEFKGTYKILNDSTFKLTYKVFGDSNVDELKIFQFNKRRLVTNNHIFNISVRF